MVDYQRSRRRRHLRKLPDIFTLNKLTHYILFGIIGFVIIVFVLFLWYSKDLPTPGKLTSAQQSESTRLYDRNGKLLYSVYKNQNRTYVKLNDIPKQVQQATIAIEDRNFYKNQGFSIIGYLRALRDIIFLRGLSGGSTITQQLVKNVLLSSERTLPRKIKELILSLQVDKRYSKDEILEMYLNDVAYGGTSIGVEAASQLYFGKSVTELNLAQSALLAGLPQSPTVYSPLSGKKYYIDRSEQVLQAMYEEKYIDKKQQENALDEIKKMKFDQKATESLKAPHFVMYVKKLLIDVLKFDDQMVENGGLQVTTTLDYDIEKKSEEILKEEIDKLKGYNVGNGSAVVMDPKTGAILAMVGSKDYFDTDNDGNFNTAVADRQPGSALKPVMYAAAFEKGYTPATLVMDVKTEFPGGEGLKPYIPANYDGKFNGPVQLRFALGNSLNIPAVKMLAKVGIKDVMQKAYDMGIANWEPTKSNISDVGLSLVLGGREATLLQIVTAYSSFANGGLRYDPIAILKVTDRKGKVLYENKNKEGRRVLSEEVSFLISHLLLDNNARALAFGPSSYLTIPGKTVSVKTGTTDEKRDNWTIGYTPSYVVGVWVGNNDNSRMNPAVASGVTGASPIWNKIMRELLKGKPDEQPKKPDTVQALEIDAYGGGLPVDGQPKRTEYFIKGTEPTNKAPIYQKLKISRQQGDKLANQAEIDRNDYDTKEYIVLKEEDPVSTDGKNRWQEGIDAWVNERYKDDQKYRFPKDASTYNYDNSQPDASSIRPTATPTPIPPTP